MISELTVTLLTTIIFSIGLVGIFLNRKNTIMILISLEILLLAININFSIFSLYLDDIVGHIFVIFILTIAAAESAIGLSLIIGLYKLKGSIKMEPIKYSWMSQFDFVIIAPLTVSLVLSLLIYYYFSLKLTVKIIKTLKFRKKIFKLLENPLNQIKNSQSMVYFNKN